MAHEIGDIIPVIVFGKAHIIEITEINGRYMETWDGRPILYPELALDSKLDVLVRAVAMIAELHTARQDAWRRVGI